MAGPGPGPARERQWFPLESNPALLNRYVSELGFETGSNEFTDVFSTEQWALDLVPRPASAVVVLFPMTEKIVRKRRQLHSEMAFTSIINDSTNSGDVWFMEQRIRNACGTMAVLHALANAPESIREPSVRPSSWLHSFLQKCPASSSSAKKAEALENDPIIESFHDDAANDSINQTLRGNKGDKIDMHFVSFVHVHGSLYELDGRVERGPIRHGSTTQQDLLRDTCRVVKQLMEEDPLEMRFTIMALAPKAS